MVQTGPSCEPVFDPGDCLATDMQFLDSDHAMILFGDIAADLGLEEEEYKWDGGTGMLHEYADGTANLTGCVYSVEDANRKWTIDAWFKNRRTYDEWIALGRFIKANPANVSNTDQWRIYEMDDTRSTITGKAGTEYDGIVLTLTQRPEGFQFGFQVGHGGNSFDADFGASTWFFYENEELDINGTGDFDIDLDCDLPTDPVCDAMLEVIVTGSGTYSIEWMVDGVNKPEYDDMTKLIDLCEGTYKVTVTDERGCTWEMTRVIECPEEENTQISTITNGLRPIEVIGSTERVLQAFPNPFTDKVSVNINSEDGETYRLVTFDAAGKVVFDETVFGTGEEIRKTIDLTNRGKGLYFISLQSEDGLSKEAKVIKAE